MQPCEEDSFVHACLTSEVCEFQVIAHLAFLITNVLRLGEPKAQLDGCSAVWSRKPEKQSKAMHTRRTIREEAGEKYIQDDSLVNKSHSLSQPCWVPASHTHCSRRAIQHSGHGNVKEALFQQLVGVKESLA